MCSIQSIQPGFERSRLHPGRAAYHWQCVAVQVRIARDWIKAVFACGVYFVTYLHDCAGWVQMMVWARKEQLVNPIKEEMGDEFSPVAQASRDSLPSPPSNPDSPGGADGQPAEGE